MKILIIEDSTRLRETLAKALGRMGHAVDVAADGHEGDSMVVSGCHDAIVLDRMLPGVDGTELLRRWRSRGLRTPVLLLTALDGVEEKVRGFGCGADDYLTKPFALAELVARLEALSRRRYDQPDPLIRAGPLVIDTAARTVVCAGIPLQLQAREFALLELLARRLGRVMSRERIEAHLYPEGSGPLSNAVDAAVCSLRRKICAVCDRPLIQTRRGQGYVLDS